MAEFVKVAALDELPPGTMKAVEMAGETIALANVDGTIYAFGNSCTHVGGPLAEGVLQEGMVVCPWHGSTFNPQTGEPINPPATQNIPTYQVQVEGNEVKVALGG